jgi:hypothetical protein
MTASIPELKHAAQQVVDARDALSAVQSKIPGCDLVHIHFNSRKTLILAASQFLRLLARDASAATMMREELKATTQTFSDLSPVLKAIPNRGGTDAQESDADHSVSAESSRLLIERALHVLEDLKSCHAELNQMRRVRPSAPLARLATRVNEALHRLEDLRRRGVELVRKDSGPPVINPIRIRVVGLGPSADLWLGVPWHLALAPEVVALCERISSANTGEPSFKLRIKEQAIGRFYLRFFSQGRPGSYRVPVDEIVDNETHEHTGDLQRLVDEFLPLLHSFLNRVFAPVKQPALGGESPGNPPSQGSAMAARDANLRVQHGKELDRKVEIVFRDDMAILADNKPVRGVAYRAILYLALRFLEGGASNLEVDTWDFARIVYGQAKTAKYVANIWDRNKRALDNVGLLFDPTTGGNWIVSNFDFQFGSKATKDAILRRLERRRPQARQRG